MDFLVKKTQKLRLRLRLRLRLEEGVTGRPLGDHPYPGDLLAAIFRRMLDARVLAASDKQPLTETIDAGSYNTLQTQFRIFVLGTGTLGKVILQHSATNEEGSFRDFPTPVEWLTGSNGVDATVSVANFLRYIRWTTNSSVAGSPLVTLDIIAKE